MLDSLSSGSTGPAPPVQLGPPRLHYLSLPAGVEGKKGDMQGG